LGDRTSGVVGLNGGWKRHRTTSLSFYLLKQPYSTRVFIKGLVMARNMKTGIFGRLIDNTVRL